MIAFIDESGDVGNRYIKGSSQYFVMSMICIPEVEIENLDKEISTLKENMGFSDSFEFHFKSNSHKQRIQFLRYLERKDVFAYSVVFDKLTTELGNKRKDIRSAIEKLLSLVHENKFPYKIVLDEMLGKKHINSISKELIKHYPGLKKMHEENSSNNNMIQIADYYAGCLNRFIQSKDSDNYFQYLRKIQKKILIK